VFSAEPLHRQYRFLRRPSWVALGSITVLLALIFVNLGLWQLNRLSETRIENAIIEQRSTVLTTFDELGLGGLDYQTAAEQHAFRLTVVSGSFLAQDESLVRSQTLNGVAGFHVITPFLLDSGLVILINRGWVPLAMNSPPVSARPPDGHVDLSVVLAGTQERGRFGPVDDEGSVILSRIDIHRIQDQLGYELVPLYGIEFATPDAESEFPTPLEIEAPTEGSHFTYAIQWFAFSVISVGGFAALARSTATKAARRRQQAEKVETAT